MSKQVLDRTNKTIILAAARGAGLSPSAITAMLAAAEGKVPPGEESPLMLTQAQKARQLGISRFTVRKMVAVGKLHPIELLPGLWRYRADELA